MLRLLRHLLLVGLLFGLVGNGVAAAAPPCNMMMQSQTSAMADMPDCDMAMKCPDCDKKQSKDTKRGCALMASCGVMLAVSEPAPAASSPYITPIGVFWPVTAVFAGRTVTPEPEPPSLLG